MLLVLLGAAGCRSLDKAAFQTFSESAGKLNASTTGAYDLLSKTDSARQKLKLITNALPPYAPTNRPILRGQTVISPDSIHERLKITAGLAAYADKLGKLAAGSDQNGFDASVSNLADALKNFRAANVTNLFSVEPGNQAIDITKLLPTDHEVEAFAKAVQFIGHKILEAATKRALRRILDEASPHIERVTTLLESDLGFANGTQGRPIEGVRGYFYRYYELQLNDRFGQNQWTDDQGNTQAWASLGIPARKDFVEAASGLVQQQMATETMLLNLRDGYAKLRSAHEALKQVVRNSQEVSVGNALTDFQESARLLQETVESVKNKP